MLRNNLKLKLSLRSRKVGRIKKLYNTIRAGLSGSEEQKNSVKQPEPVGNITAIKAASARFEQMKRGAKKL
jgi:hypothetical protein